MTNSLKLIMAIIAFLSVCFLGIGIFTSKNNKATIMQPTVTLPIQAMKEEKINEPLLNMPVGAALIVDVSGTMDPYQITRVNQKPLIDYIVTRLNTIWIPKIVVAREDNPSFNQRYRITQAYGLGTSVKRVLDFSSYGAIKKANPGSFLAYTATDQATQLVAELMSSVSQDVSTVIMITDMEIDIGVGRDCPRGTAPYCVVEKLRPLYEGTSGPGWWLVGFDVPYKQSRRPLFLSIWSYDIPQTREMIALIVQDLLANMGNDTITDDNIHVLELYPADYWKPVVGRPWEPKGRITYKNGAPLKWLKPESSFVVTSPYEDAELDFSLSRFDQDRKGFELPYEQTFQVRQGEKTLKNISFGNVIINDGTIDFKGIISAGQFSGSFSRPDVVDVIVTVFPRFNLVKLPWVSEWSQRISQFNHVIEGANSIVDIEKKTLTSQPIRLKFRKR